MTRFGTLILLLLILLMPGVIKAQVQPGVTTNMTTNRIVSGTSNTLSVLLTQSTVQMWASAAAGAKSQVIPACTAGNANNKYLAVVDAQGNASTNPINISGGVTYSITVNNAAATFQCDGPAGVWRPVGAFAVTGGDTVSTTVNSAHQISNIPPIYRSVTTSCAVNDSGTGSAGCSGTTNDYTYVLTATVSGITLTLPSAPAIGSPVQNFGYDSSHTYTVQATGPASIYNCGASGTSVVVGPLLQGMTLVSDGANWSCIPSTQPIVVVPLSGTTPTITPVGGGSLYTLTLSGNTTISNPTSISIGQVLTFILTQAAGGGDTVSWGNEYTPPLPAMPTTAGFKMAVTCIADTISSLVCSTNGGGAGGGGGNTTPNIANVAGTFFNGGCASGCVVPITSTTAGNQLVVVGFLSDQPGFGPTYTVTVTDSAGDTCTYFADSQNKGNGATFTDDNQTAIAFICPTLGATASTSVTYTLTSSPGSAPAVTVFAIEAHRPTGNTPGYEKQNGSNSAGSGGCGNCVNSSLSASTTNVNDLIIYIGQCFTNSGGTPTWTGGFTLFTGGGGGMATLLPGALGTFATTNVWPGGTQGCGAIEYAVVP